MSDTRQLAVLDSVRRAKQTLNVWLTVIALDVTLP